MTEKLDFKIRKAKQDDVDFIISTWLRSLYETLKWEIKKDLFFVNHNNMVKERMPFMKCLVACNPEDEDQIFGYIVFNTPRTFHYAFTKKYLRRLGVFKALMREAQLDMSEIYASHRGPEYKLLCSKYPFTYNPYSFIEVNNVKSI